MREGECVETTGNTPATCTMSWQEWTALLQAYISWMNSQLRKKAGYRRVLDLRTDLQDGVALAQLVEILGGKRVPDLDEAPCTLVARRKNVERLIHHLTSSKVNIPEASGKGIIEGDLRRVLQLIHAVAAHFKPSSVQKKINPNNVWNANQESNIKIQPEKRNGVFRAQQRLLPAAKKTNNQPGKNESNARESKLHVSSVVISRSETPPKNRVNIPARVDKSACSTSLPSQRVALGGEGAPVLDGSERSLDSTSQNVNGNPERDMNCCRLFDTGKHSKENGSSLNGKSNLNEQKWGEDERKSIAEDVIQARKQLLYLRDILMRGYNDPRRRLRVDEKSKNIAGSDRMSIKSLKLDDNFHIGDILEENERLRFENENLTKQVEKKDNELANCKDEVELLEDKLGDLKAGGSSPRKSKVGQRERNGTSQTADGMEAAEDEERAKDGAHLESQDVLLPLPYRSRFHDSQLLVVKDALTSLRKCFPTTDSNQHTLDTIEQSVATLLERVSVAEAIANNSFQMDGATSPKEWLYMDSTNDRRYVASPTSDASLYPASSVGGQSRTYIERHTKVIYFLNKSTTPFITSVPKKIGDISLRDFKILFDRPGKFRFHFKTLDPDYGMVKEEVSHDDDILPGWDNKVIGWVEDDI